MAKRPSPPPAAPNKAQAEFDRYARRRQAQQAAAGPPGGPAAAPFGGPFPDGGLTWAAPFGVGMAPVYVAGPPAGPGGGGDGSLTQGIGTTVRLGVDLLNAALVSGIKVLGGFAGGYGHGHQEGGGCGGGCGCESCCEPSCCQPDCCGCDCCHPGVGTCC